LTAARMVASGAHVLSDTMPNPASMPSSSVPVV
jgi:hypothetical protein